jgi:hypothetical protein
VRRSESRRRRLRHPEKLSVAWSMNDVKIGPLTATQHGELRLSVTSRLFMQFRLIIEVWPPSARSGAAEGKLMLSAN